ncbi:DUF6266 family protein [Pedobacter sp. AW31-3R]|uniref:DUF6266 family protein n=1 Tax=Pedobacter sp. AW31-3R TaxID=3445781 RepID=UPI003FA0B058
MGRIINRDILGEISGAVGTVVISKWRNLTTIRSRPEKRKHKKTSPQQARQNDIFRTITDFLQPLKDIVNLGFQDFGNSGMSPVNMACSDILLNGIVKEEEDFYIDLAKVRFSKPIRSTQCAWNPTVKAEEGRKITFTWELNPFPKKCTQLDDTIVVVCYNRERDYFQTRINCTQRSELSFSITKFNDEIGQEVFCYLFMASADKKLVSETEFLGSVIVKP